MNRQLQLDFIRSEAELMTKALHIAAQPYINDISKLKVKGHNGDPTETQATEHAILTHNGIRLPIYNGYIAIAVKPREFKTSNETSQEINQSHEDSASIGIHLMIDDRKTTIASINNITSKDGVKFIGISNIKSTVDNDRLNLQSPRDFLEEAFRIFFRYVHNDSIRDIS